MGVDVVRWLERRASPGDGSHRQPGAGDQARRRARDLLSRLRVEAVPGNLDQALVAFERAIALDPNLAVAHNYVGQLKVFLGRANEAAEHTLKAIRLSPRDPQLAEWYYQVALTYIHQRRYNEAVEWARRGVQVNPNLRYPYRVLAVALALSGRVEEARTVAAEMLRRYPKEIDHRISQARAVDRSGLSRRSGARDRGNAACRRPGVSLQAPPSGSGHPPKPQPPEGESPSAPRCPPRLGATNKSQHAHSARPKNLSRDPDGLDGPRRRLVDIGRLYWDEAAPTRRTPGSGRSTVMGPAPGTSDRRTGGDTRGQARFAASWEAQPAAVAVDLA